jgi:Tfp pilus assembly protein PilN
MRTLNLARQPFRNERLPTLVLTLAIALLAVLSIRHALVARDLRPGGSRDAEHELARLEKEGADLRTESNELRGVNAQADAIKEWNAVRDLVDRRAFSWTGLFAALEGALPPGVRLTAVSPSSSAGPIVMQLVAVGRSVEDALALPKALQAQGEFEGAFLDSYAETERGVDIKCTVRYVGRGTAPTAGGRR